MVHLFRIEKKDFIDPDHFEIKGDDLIHIKKSLRKKEKDHIFATDGLFIYKSKIKKLKEDSLAAEIISKKKACAQVVPDISLFTGITRFSNFELLLNYTAQLGVKEIYPMNTEYSQNISVSPNKLLRWKKIINEASKQSFNPFPPVLKKIIPFNEAIEFKGEKLLLHPYTDNKIKDILEKMNNNKINIYIGPEAGFSECEIKLACKNKINIVKLGYNILRSETAVITLVSNIIFYYQ